ncbi:MAG: hypothetical protein ABIH26_01670, partial [Candidatus Eisenbacteria bacterium]
MRALLAVLGILILAGLCAAEQPDSADSVTAEFRHLRKQVSEKDAAALYRLSEWCAEKRLAVDRILLLAEVIAADPDHAEARALLGYTNHEGRWLTEDELDEAKGLVRYGSSWLPPRCHTTTKKRGVASPLLFKERGIKGLREQPPLVHPAGRWRLPHTL